jgi:aerobic carbon-monoxide dehydrogenase large subunit
VTDTSVPPMNSPIGQPLRRREDARFLTGAGQFTDDVVMHGQTCAAFRRSPHAHARIRSIDAEAAKRAPGVLRIFTGADLADAKVGGLPCGWLIHSKDGSPMKEPPHPVLAQGPVALVVAETLTQAKDAAELIVVDYEELPAVIDLTQAEGHKGSVHDEVANNVCYDWDHGNQDAVDAAFKTAAQVSTLDIVNNRLIANAMEPRAANASYTLHDESYALCVANQNPHGSNMDYAMSRASDIPNFNIGIVVTSCTHNPLGVKGCGEAGAIGSPPAYINALTDALGVKDIAMPATVERVWRAANA